MNHFTNNQSESAPAKRSRRLPLALAAAAMTAGIFAVASPGASASVAPADSSPAAETTVSATGDGGGITQSDVDNIRQDLAAYTQFMHDHGVDLPAPTVTLDDNALTIDNAGIDDATFDSPAFQAANQAWDAQVEGSTGGYVQPL